MSEQWEKVNELFYAALELQIEKRDDFLKNACGTDDTLRKEVEGLLAAYQQAGGFIQTPALKNALQWFTDSEKQLQNGQRIGAYKIIREIGRGGMGAVYLAARADQQFEKHVAIKLIKRGMDTASVLRRFRIERQILANFDHPNIARLLDGGTTDDGLPYFVMEYVEGQSIDDYCDSRTLSITERLELFRQVCIAVSYAHRHLVIHRDIKPSNIVVTKEGVTKLLDFGIAKILDPASMEEAGATATGIRPMTPEYASPEQARGGAVTTVSDVYSMGIVLYELLTGRFPYRFENLTALEIARIITETDPKIPSSVISSIETNEDDTPSTVTPESISKSREGTLERLRRRLRGDLDNIVLKAIRKEPERRYQSVEQLSEDIRRHLEGLPVFARKDTLFYRSAKFARRNKIAVTIAVLAFLAIAISAIIVGVIQWRANQQAKFLQEFGQEAARIEGIMRFAYLLPLHDVTPERKKVEQRIHAINSRMMELGGPAFGPGHYAMGRGFMALQQYEEARKHFESALKQYDYKTPEVASAYGLTLAMLYQTELQNAGRINSKVLRETRLNQIKKEFKEPALSYIREGSHSSEYSEYAEAVVEFLDEHYQKAIQKSELAIRQNPWLYESKRLEGEAYRNIGTEFSNKGENSGALDSYQKADQAFEISIRNGTSDPSGYVGLCTLKANMMRVQLRMGTPAENTYAMGKEICQKALEADPNNASAYLALSNLHFLWASDYTFRQMTDRRFVFQQSIQAAKKSILLQPKNPETHKALGVAYTALAANYYLDGLDPSELVTAGRESYARAIEINPNDAASYLSCGWLIWYKAERMRVTGIDPRGTADEAYQSVQTAIRINPQNFSSYHAAGNILYSKGAYERAVGLDPLQSWESAIQLFQKSISINPAYMNAYIVLGYVAYTQAEHLESIGRNPYESLALAEKTYQSALLVNPKLAELTKGMAYCNLRKGEFSVDAGSDPTEYLTKARSFIKQALEADSSNAEFYEISGEIELVAARWKMLQHASPDPQIKSALLWVDRSLKIPSGYDFDSISLKAKIYQRSAEWKLETKRSADQESRLGLDMVSRALKINPRATEMIATRGVLLLLAARSTSNDAQKQEFAEKAQASLQEALKINRNLSRTYTPYLKEAQILMN